MPAAEADLLNSDLWDTAFHEAGHAVIQMKKKLPFASITAKADLANQHAGLMKGSGKTYQNRNFDFLLIALAGPIAEELYNELEEYGKFLRKTERIKWRQFILAIGGDFPIIPHWCSGKFERRDVPNSDSGDDYTQAVKQIEYLCRYDTSREITLNFIRETESKCESLLRKHWPLVLKLAHSLIRRKSHSMTYLQVCSLLKVKPISIAVPRNHTSSHFPP